MDHDLSDPEVLHHEAQASIHRVIPLQPLVHLNGLLPQVVYLEISRRDISPLILDLFVQNKLKLLQLLRLLLQMKDITLQLMNVLVFLVDLSLLFLPFVR